MRRRNFLLWFVGSALAACSKQQKLAAFPAGSRVLAFGDSVTYGTGASTGEDWPTLLSDLTGWRIANGGVPGDTAQASISRMGSLLEEHKPVLVIIEIGGNDFLRRRSESAVKQDIKTLIGLARSAGAQVVLVGVPSLSLITVVAGKAADAPLYGELGKEENIPVIGDVFSDVLSRPELCADKIHPNAAGYRRMAADIYSSLKQFGLTR